MAVLIKKVNYIILCDKLCLLFTHKISGKSEHFLWKMGYSEFSQRSV